MTGRNFLVALFFLTVAVSGCNKKRQAEKKFNDYNDKANVIMTRLQNDLITYENWMKGYSKEEHSLYKKEIKSKTGQMQKLLKDLNSIKVTDKEVEDFRSIHRKAIEKIIEIFRLHRKMLDSGGPPYATNEIKQLFSEYKDQVTAFQKKREEFKKKYRPRDRK